MTQSSIGPSSMSMFGSTAPTGSLDRRVQDRLFASPASQTNSFANSPQQQDIANSFKQDSSAIAPPQGAFGDASNSLDFATQSQESIPQFSGATETSFATKPRPAELYGAPVQSENPDLMSSNDRQGTDEFGNATFDPLTAQSPNHPPKQKQKTSEPYKRDPTLPPAEQLLTDSVGRGGANHPQDVKYIQKLLNAARDFGQLPGTGTYLREDGVADEETLSAPDEYLKQHKWPLKPIKESKLVEFMRQNIP